VLLAFNGLCSERLDLVDKVHLQCKFDDVRHIFFCSSYVHASIHRLQLETVVLHTRSQVELTSLSKLELCGALSIAYNVRNKFIVAGLEEMKAMGLRIHRRAQGPLSVLLGLDGCLEHCPIKRLHVSGEDISL
jgi:hypothetical protein